MTGQVLHFPTTHEPWLDAKDLAHHFKVSLATVRRWQRAGMPSSSFGASRRFRVSECESWHREGAA